MTDPVEELASLRAVLNEALSDAPDPTVSQGALELRRKFSSTLMALRDREVELAEARRLRPADLATPVGPIKKGG